MSADKGTAPPDRIGLFARAFFEGAGPALTTMLNRPISVAVLGVEDVTAADLQNRMPLPWVLLEVRYSRGLSGGHWLILGKSGALMLGHAMAGEDDGEAMELQPSHEEAIRETVNQILGAASSALMPLVQRSVSYEAATLQVVEDTDALPPDLAAQPERLWLAQAEATGPDGFRAGFMLTVGSELAREIVTIAAESDGPAPAQSARPEHAPSGIDLILDVPLPVAVELGRARMQIQDVLKLAPGSIVELDKSAGDPVDILINGRPIAKGEVVVIDENFGVRLTSIITATERIKMLR
jgi:flagellar motor switch protein FliN/FliY